MTTILSLIQAEETLRDLARNGDDAKIAELLNAQDDKIDVPRRPTEQEVARVIAQHFASVKVDLDSLAFLLRFVGDDAVLDEIRKLLPPEAGVEFDALRTRKGSRAEHALGRQVVVAEVSAALAPFRPGGKTGDEIPPADVIKEGAI